MKDFLKSKRNRQFLFFVLGAICLYFYTKNKAKEAEAAKWNGGFVGGLSGGENARVDAGTTTPTTPTIPETPTTPQQFVSRLLGAFEVTAGGKTYSYSKSPNFIPFFSEDGLISDVTPGLVNGTPMKLNGRNVFYMLAYSHFVANGDGAHVYKSLNNVRLPDGAHTLRRFECDAAKIPDQGVFESKLHGYSQASGVNMYNATLSEINVVIRSNGGSNVPGWLKISRALNFLPNIPNRAIGKKIFAIEAINSGDSPAAYWAKGVHTQLQFNGAMPNQPYTFRTLKWGHDLAPGMPLFTDAELYDSLRGFISQFGLTKDSVITDEYPENAQGQDPDIGSRVGKAYQGALDKLREAVPGLSKRDTNLFGSYGADDYYGLIFRGAISTLSRSDFARYLGDKVFSSFDLSNGVFRNDTAAYYSSGQINYRNVNVSYYMYNDVRHIPFELLTTNERVKIGTKTYENQDRESDWAVFGTILCQSLVNSDNGTPMGVEYAHSGEIIPYANGEIWRYPSANSMIGEHHTLGFWSTLLGRGIMLWSGGGKYGTDETKVSYYTPNGWPIKWRLTGGEWQNYQPGVNGAPANTEEGIADHLYAAVTDVTMWGRQDALQLVDGYADVIYYASYTSSRKSFTAAAGQTGFHLNGFGALNKGMITFKDAFDQKCGTSIITTGGSGWAAVYYNGFLSADEYEDNVTVSHAGQSINLGRVYGRQTVFKKF